MSNPAPITLEQLFRFKRPWGELPHQDAAISELEADIRTSGYAVAMRRDRPWFKTWSQAGKQPATPSDALRPLLDIIAAGEGDYSSANRGRAGDTPAGYPGLDQLTIAAARALRNAGWFALGRYQFIPDTFDIAVRDAKLTGDDLFSPKNQDLMAIALLTGGKRPKLRDYLQGKDVSLEDAQLELAKEWASIPMANGRGFYDGDRAGNRASADVARVQDALRQGRASLGGKVAPAQQRAKLPPHLRLSRTGRINSRGLEELRLQRIVNSIPMGELIVVSGAPGRQEFRIGRLSKAGSLEPLPEGRWGVEDIAWAGGKDNYAASWGPALGPASVPLHYQAPGRTDRSAIEIHYDANHGSSPGTAGCIGMQSINDLKTLIGWLRADDPRQLYVDWGLGTCPAVR